MSSSKDESSYTPLSSMNGDRLLNTLGVFALGFTFDQVIKLSALSALADGTAIELLPSVSFRLAFNPG
ncbi:MAG: hypothetical protein ABWY57_09320, partial [Mycetocola sp.]